MEYRGVIAITYLHAYLGKGQFRMFFDKIHVTDELYNFTFTGRILNQFFFDVEEFRYRILIFCTVMLTSNFILCSTIRRPIHVDLPIVDDECAIKETQYLQITHISVTVSDKFNHVGWNRKAIDNICSQIFLRVLIGRSVWNESPRKGSADALPSLHIHGGPSEVIPFVCCSDASD